MELTFLGTTSNNGSCPNLYRTDRDTYVVQGERITDAQLLATLRAQGADHETAVEIPAALLTFLPEGFQEHQMELTFIGPNVYKTDSDTYVVLGARVADAQALATLRERGLPDHETAVEVPAALFDLVPQGS